MQPLQMNSYFKIVCSNFIESDTDEYYDLNNLFRQLYFKLFHTRNVNIDDIVIINYYMDIPVARFNICYQHGLIMYNDENRIRVSSICPELSAIDVTANYLSKTTNYRTIDRRSNTTSRYATNAKIANDLINIKKISEECSGPKQQWSNPKQEWSNPKQEWSSPKKDISDISKPRGEKFRIFESDKKSYIQMKNDITRGVLKAEQINPLFVIKYQIFKILESRNSLDVTSNKDIELEYKTFLTLYDICLEDEEKQDTHKIYVPYNYHYMTDEEKTGYAKKYKLSKHQFEDRYVNNLNDDAIEKCIFNAIPICEEEDKVSDTDSSSVDKLDDETFSDLETFDNLPTIDSRFIELCKNYNCNK